MKQVYAICRDSNINFGKVPEGEDHQPTLDLLDEVPQLRAICCIVWGYGGGQYEFVDENLQRLKVIEVPPGTGSCEG